MPIAACRALAVGTLVALAGCAGAPPEDAAPEALHRAQHALTATIVDDVFSPPVAARIYAYASLAAYEAYGSAAAEDAPPALAGHLNGYSPPPAAPAGARPGLAALEAFHAAARALVFTPGPLDAERADWKAGLSGDTAASLAHGRAVAAHVLAYAAADGYAETRTMPQHPAAAGEDQWIPTPPLFMAGIEPNWNRIRPFTLDSAAQFRPAGPTPFGLEPGSAFRAELEEVHRVALELSPEQEAIARFWDCNPYVTQEQAHLMPGIKKITPGGHWMGIARTACTVADADFARSATAYLWTAVSLHDAFISCWDEKYRSNLVRPETLIGRYLDPDWKPLLETPPFPEHTSGHSVISAASAEALSALFGAPFPYVDSVEVEYGLPPRAFAGFREASAEAAISRLYGGIHYRPAIERGVTQGRAVGAHVLSRLPAAGTASASASASGEPAPPAAAPSATAAR